MSQFNALLLEISNQLSADELDKMKFVLGGGVLTKRDRERIDTTTKLFTVLTERGKLGPDNREFLCQLFEEIRRPDLADKLQGIQSPPPTAVPPPAERAKLDIATEVIADNLGRNWRKLGRKLRLTEVKLESISKRHPTELEETTVELIKEWRKTQGAEARTEDLIKALRDCQFKLTADKVESRLADLRD